MPTLVINTLEPLGTIGEKKLEGIIGEFTERCPKLDGVDLYAQTCRIMQRLDETNQETIESGLPMATAMDELLDRCEIPDKEWEWPVVVLTCAWNYAGIQVRYGAFMRAVARRAVDVKVFEFYDDAPHLNNVSPVTWDPTQIGRDAAGIKPARILAETTQPSIKE